MLDALLDRSLVFSFDATGFARHARRFAELPERDLHGRDVLITGGTRGIGLAAATALGRRGARLHLWARDPEAGAAAVTAVQQAGGEATFTSVDLGDLDAVGAAAHAVELPNLAGVVCNAGSMPWTRQLTPQGHELTWASQVLAHVLLGRVLRRRDLFGPPSRVVWVSSGGMYGARLDLSDLRRDHGYERHAVYAQAKRAQVEIAAAAAASWPEVPHYSMHPGWVDTAAVRHSMPWFHRLTRPILRTPEQGADTITWLVATAARPPTGRFYFDRRPRPEHLVRGTRTDPEVRQTLLEAVWRDTDPWVADPR